MLNNEAFDLEDHIESKNKSFDDRNEEKKEIHHNVWFKITKIWQIRLCKIWVNIWSEMSKWNDFEFQRPVLIVSKPIWWHLVCVIPFSTQPAKSEETKQFTIEFTEREKHWLDRSTNLIINHFRIISTKRLKRLFNDIEIGGTMIPLLPKWRVKELLNIFINKILP